MITLNIQNIMDSVKKNHDLIDIKLKNYNSSFMVDNFTTINNLKQTRLRKEFNQLCKNKLESKNLETSLSINDKKIYICKEKQVRDIPSILNKIFPNYKKLYLLGVSFKNSFLHSILSITDSQFILKGHIQKEHEIDNLRNKSSLEIDTIFKKFDYKKKKYKKSTIRDNILSSNNYLPQTINFIVDYFNLCLIFIDTDTHLFSQANGYSKDKKFIVMLKKNNIYQPILGTDGIHYFDYKILDEMENVLKPEMEVDKSELVNSNDLSNFKLPEVLEKITKYKITELQQMSKEKNISIFIDGSKKKKLKKDLYQELLQKY